MTHTPLSSDIDAHSLRFVTAPDCFIAPGNDHILTLTSNTIINADVFLAPCGCYISGGLAIAPSVVQFHNDKALVTAVKPTSPDALPQGNAVICFAGTGPLFLVPLHAVSPYLSTSTDDHSTTAASTSAINPDLAAAQRGELLALLQKQSERFI